MTEQCLNRRCLGNWIYRNLSATNMSLIKSNNIISQKITILSWLWVDSKNYNFELILSWLKKLQFWVDSKNYNFELTQKITILSWLKKLQFWVDSKNYNFELTQKITILSWLCHRIVQNVSFFNDIISVLVKLPEQWHWITLLHPMCLIYKKWPYCTPCV